MPVTDKFFAINIRKYLALGDDQEAGEPALVKLLSGFSCPKNPDLERFLKKSAIEFTKKNQSVTQCHLDKDDAKNSVCRNMYPVLFLYNFINHLTG